MKVLLVTLDDIGPELLAAANTPQLDALLSAGVFYSRFIAGPYCSNFRAKLQLGLYSPHPDNLTGHNFKADSPESLPALPSSLGYVGNSAQVGKWHLCVWAENSHRGAHGYDYYAGCQSNLGSGGSGNYFSWDTIENGIPRHTNEYATDYVMTHAVAQLQSGRDFVHASFNVAHKPVHAPPGYTESSTVAMLEYADARIAAVCNAGLNHGYSVIFTTDNGEPGSGKGNLSTEALNMPLYLLGPWPALSNTSSPVDTTDLHATIWFAVRGSVPPGTHGVPLQGAWCRGIAFADLFPGVRVQPDPTWVEMATDGVLKVFRRPATGAWNATTWDDEPTTDSVAHLLAALDERLA
jgi:arylsulfatase A-like enzyme